MKGQNLPLIWDGTLDFYGVGTGVDDTYLAAGISLGEASRQLVLCVGLYNNTSNDREIEGARPRAVLMDRMSKMTISIIADSAGF